MTDFFYYLTDKCGSIGWSRNLVQYPEMRLSVGYAVNAPFGTDEEVQPSRITETNGNISVRKLNL